MFTPAEQTFIQTHLTADVRALALQQPPGIDVPRVVAQLQARQKARIKLPTWYANPRLVFPPPLSVEQASSEAAATYKASLVSGHDLLDLTGGMGVDTAAFARRISHVTYLEQQPDVAATAAHNLAQLGLTNVMTHVGDGLAFLRQRTQPADWIYLDPARRDDRGGRVADLASCQPDVLAHLPLLLNQGRQLLLKTSPMLDLDATLRQLPTCAAVHVVAVQGEVKELLFVMQPTPPAELEVVAVDLRGNVPARFAFRRTDEARATVTLADVLTQPPAYLYEPSAAVLKAGAFRLVGERFGLEKIAPHSHLYTANRHVPHFPGRVFCIDAILKVDRKALQPHVPGGQANLTVRHFPQSVEALRRQLGLREGGDTYLFATTLPTNQKRLFVTRKALP